MKKISLLYPLISTLTLLATAFGTGAAVAQVPIKADHFFVKLPAKSDPDNNPSLLVACSSTKNDLSGVGGSQYEMVLAFPDSATNSVKVRTNRGVNLAWVWLKFTDVNVVPLWHATQPRGIGDFNKTANQSITNVNVLGLGYAPGNIDRLMKSVKNGFSVDWEPAKVGDKYPDKRTTAFDLSQLADDTVKANYQKVCNGNSAGGGMFAKQ
jgi:hypothetical protein